MTDDFSDGYTSDAFPHDSEPSLPAERKYLESEDWPVGEGEVFGTFRDDDLARAVREAERRLEADVNAGKEIENPTGLHSLAAAYWTAYRLSRTTKHPASAYRGETASDPDGKASYAHSLKEDYFDLVGIIEATDADDVDDPGSGPDTRGTGDFVRTATPGRRN